MLLISEWISLLEHLHLFFSFQHAPGVPRILVGNRLHLAFKRQVPTEQARAYAEKNGMTFFEVSPLCNFNVIESFTELSRIVLMRHGMEKFWRPNRGELTRTPACNVLLSAHVQQIPYTYRNTHHTHLVVQHVHSLTNWCDNLGSYLTFQISFWGCVGGKWNNKNDLCFLMKW